MANDVGLWSWLGRLGLPAGAVAVLTSVANIDLWLVPLALWGIVFGMRLLGTHLALWPGAGAPIEDLTKSGDLQAAFPSGFAQGRLRVLFDRRGRRSRVAMTVQAVDRGLSRWFGDAVWSTKAVDRTLKFAALYPLALLLLVWVGTGQGRLGNEDVLPITWPFWKRCAVTAGLLWMVLSVRDQFASAMKQTSAWSFFLSLTLAIGTLVASVLLAVFAEAGLNIVGIATALTIGSLALVGLVAGAVIYAGAVLSSGLNSHADVLAAVGGTVCILLKPVIDGFVGGRRPKAAAVLLIAGWLTTLTLVAWLLPQHAAAGSSDAAATRAFVVFFFLGAVPVWNATLDLISVVTTRVFLRRYLCRADGWWWMIAADLALAVGLTVLLFWGVLAGLLLMQHWGWGVDAKTLVEQFRANPADPQVSWLTLMALTNILPTLGHLGLAFFGVVTGWLYKDEVFALELQLKREGPAASPIIGAPAAAATGERRLVLKTPLSKTQAIKMVNWVYVDVWLIALLPLALALTCWPAWRWLMTQALYWLPA